LLEPPLPRRASGVFIDFDVELGVLSLSKLPPEPRLPRRASDVFANLGELVDLGVVGAMLMRVLELVPMLAAVVGVGEANIDRFFVLVPMDLGDAVDLGDENEAWFLEYMLLECDVGVVSSSSASSACVCVCVCVCVSLCFDICMCVYLCVCAVMSYQCRLH
jgi:hypothetical protein